MPSRSPCSYLGLSVLLLVACADPGVESEQQQTEAGTAPRLTIDKHRILDPDGHQIVLRGYNWGQWDTWQPDDGNDNASDGAYIGLARRQLAMAG